MAFLTKSAIAGSLLILSLLFANSFAAEIKNNSVEIRGNLLVSTGTSTLKHITFTETGAASGPLVYSTSSDGDLGYGASQFIAGAGLTGGGTVVSDRTFAVGAGTGVTVNADDVQLAPATALTLKSNVTAFTAVPLDNSLSTVLDMLGSNQGALPMRGASTWGLLTPGTSGLPLISNGAGADLSYSAIGSSAVTDGSIALADMADLAQDRIIGRATGAGTGVPTALTVLPDGCEPAHTGDVTNNAGSLILSIGADKVTNAMLDNMAPLTIKCNTDAVFSTNPVDVLLTALFDTLYSTRGGFFVRGAATWGGLALGAAGKLLRSNGTDLSYSTFTIPDTAVAGDILYASAMNVYSSLADVAAGSYLRSGGVSTAPVWSTLTLPNTCSDFAVPFAAAANVLGSDTSKLSFDDGASFALGIGTATPGADIGGVGLAIKTANPFIQPRAIAGLGVLNFQRANGSGTTIVANADIVGDLRFAGYSGSAFVNAAIMRVTIDGTPGASNDMPGAIDFLTTPDGSGSLASRLKIGNAGTLTALATYSVTVGGTNRDLFIDNTGLIGFVSSARVVDGEVNKINEKPLPDETAEKILALEPKMYDRPDGTKDEVGLIAEDVEQVMPEIVSYATSETTQVAQRDGTTFFQRVALPTAQPETVSYSKLIVPMLAVVQKQQARIEALEARCGDLDARLAKAGL